MRKYEEKQTTQTSTVLIETTCDLCGRIAKDGNWERSLWEVAESEIEIEIKTKDGVEYPEGGHGTKIIVDMCPQCFKEKLVPWLKSQGATVDEIDWDY